MGKLNLHTQYLTHNNMHGIFFIHPVQSYNEIIKIMKAFLFFLRFIRLYFSHLQEWMKLQAYNSVLFTLVTTVSSFL
jgi:hypothetical protein